MLTKLVNPIVVRGPTQMPVALISVVAAAGGGADRATWCERRSAPAPRSGVKAGGGRAECNRG